MPATLEAPKIEPPKAPALPPTSHTPKPYTGPSAEQVLAKRKQFLNPGLFLYYKKPVMFVEGKMQYIWDDAGKRYLDGLAGIVTISVGHCHPHVVAAATRQNETLQHSTTIYLHPNIAEYAQKLASKLPGYLKHAYEHVRAAGGVCIADEVQTGFGRTGTHFWGFETQGVIPDIVTMAKGIGNGCPLAAVVTTPQIAAVLAQRIHFNTFGGNPVVCAIGKAGLEVIEREKLQENSLKLGRYILAGLEKLKAKHSIIGDVRGKGLMLGIELVKDRASKEPAKAECAQIMESCREMGLLV